MPTGRYRVPSMATVARTYLCLPSVLKSVDNGFRVERGWDSPGTNRTRYRSGSRGKAGLSPALPHQDIFLGNLEVGIMCCAVFHLRHWIVDPEAYFTPDGSWKMGLH